MQVSCHFICSGAALQARCQVVGRWVGGGYETTPLNRVDGYISPQNFLYFKVVDTYNVFMDENTLNLSEKLREKRISDLLKKVGGHGLSPSEYQVREKLRLPEGDPERLQMERVLELERQFKSRIGKPELLKPEGGAVLPQALIEMAMLEGGAKALSIPSLNEGEDEKMQQINALNKKKYLESLSRGP